MSAAERAAPPFAPIALAFALIVVSFFLRTLWLEHPATQFIFDESYYVSAARTILGLPQAASAPYAKSAVGLDPNGEHPPLGKLIMAADMAALGDTPWGWRWGSVVAGTLCIAWLFRLARTAGMEQWGALLAAFLFAFDNLVFVTSRIGILDIFMLLGVVAGVACFLAGRPLLSALAFAFGTLGKEYGAYGPLIITAFVAIQTVLERPERSAVLRRLRGVLSMVVLYGAALLLALWLLDQRWSAIKNPLAQLQHIWQYGTGLRNPAGPTGIASWPWAWLRNGGQIPYYRVVMTICSDQVTPCPATAVTREYTSVLFRGAMNPYLILTAPAVFGLVLHRLVRHRERPASLAVVWLLATYLPFIPAAVLDHRISYSYYMLPVVPALALAGALFGVDRHIPRSVATGYVIAILFGFLAYFPFVGFQPPG